MSLFELNTLAHATCALFVYTQWWSKPLNILEPSVIRDSEKAQQFWCLLHLVSSIPKEISAPSAAAGLEGRCGMDCRRSWIQLWLPPFCRFWKCGMVCVRGCCETCSS
jgi:hypothetical protein